MVSFLNSGHRKKIMYFAINWLIMSITTLILVNILIFFRMNYYYSHIVWYAIVMIVNYMVSAKYIFIWKFNIFTIINFIISQICSLLLFTFISWFMHGLWINTILAQLISISFSATFSYVYNNYITFGRKKSKP